MVRETEAARAVRAAWDGWLYEHSAITVPTLIQEAVAGAVRAWLDDHGEDIVAAVVRPYAQGLIGVYGHTLDEKGQIIWQFVVERRVAEDAYLVQLFSWIDGGPSELARMTTGALFSDRCRLYPSAEAMHRAYEKAR